MLQLERDPRGERPRIDRSQPHLHRAHRALEHELLELAARQRAVDAELAAMHGRAKAAGMDPYGSAPEQMHYVPHAPQGAVVDNGWQRFWLSLQVDKLLALIESSTHSAFEDTSNPLH